MMILDSLTYTAVVGTRTSPQITVFALSTCGFCKRAMAFLQNNSISYRYIHVDTIPIDTKNEIKRELKERFKVDVAFPFATVGDDKYLVGFIEVDWKLTLGV
ncbi:MAG TPA: glutaredoxin [bacterium]|nr:glutaredoxin [bacterium]